jgi:integrase/recombinase XerD
MTAMLDSRGQRLYLTQQERLAFLQQARRATLPERALCETLTFTGCRLSEALALTPASLDCERGVLVFRTLKKRHMRQFRAVPVPACLIALLQELQTKTGHKQRYWHWSRTTSWRRIKGIMLAAHIRSGPHASPKGLRHAFGLSAVSAGVPVTTVMTWLGHASPATTALYTQACGPEEQALAARMWHHDPALAPVSRLAAWYHLWRTRVSSSLFLR